MWCTCVGAGVLVLVLLLVLVLVVLLVLVLVLPQFFQLCLQIIDLLQVVHLLVFILPLDHPDSRLQFLLSVLQVPPLYLDRPLLSLQLPPLEWLQQRYNAVLVIGINRRKWCLRRWMWSLSLASRDMATDSQPSHSQPAPISARYPVPHAEEAASQALVLGLARAMSKPREQTTTTNRNLAHPSK